jgi:6-phosphogluconolactonase
MKLLVGTYTSRFDDVRGTGKGIHTCHLDASTGLITTLAVAGTDNPSFLALDPSVSRLYAANESMGDPGAADGALSAFCVDRGSGRLAFLNAVPSRGRAPCHVAVDPTGRFLLSANYWGGSFLSHRILADGSIGPSAGEIRPIGRGRDPLRQEAPHAHSIVAAPTGRAGAPSFLALCDLGRDRVIVAAMDAVTGALRVHGEAAVSPGAGPRQIEFDRSGRHAYVVTEMGAGVIVLDWDPDQGRLVEKQEVPILDEEDSGKRWGTEIRLSADGRHAYASNRGADCITCYAVDPDTGTLKALFRELLPGRTPRHTAFSPAGNLFLVACQDSHQVLVYRREPVSGTLRLLATNSLPSPACLLPVPE